MQEDRDGYPFNHGAPAGRVLDKCLNDTGIDRDRCYLTNVVKHRPLDNKIANFPDAVEVCREHYLLPELAAVKPAEGPFVVVCLGNVAGQYWFGKQTGAARVLPDGTVVIHAPHPSAIARGNMDARPRLIRALEMAKVEAQL